MQEDKEIVSVPVIQSYGCFGFAINNIKHMSVMGNLIVFWFNEDHMDPEHGWDLQVPFDTTADAEQALSELQDTIRRLKIQRVK